MGRGPRIKLLLSSFFIALFLGLFVRFTTPRAWSAQAPASIEGKDNWSNQSLILKTWANYSGPQIATPSIYTTAKNGKTNLTAQHLDTLFTLGYHVAPDIVPGIGIPLDLGLTKTDFQFRPVYFGVIELRIFHSTYFSILTDVRFYLPFGELAAKQDFQTGFRTSQSFTYAVPRSQFTLGAKTYFRVTKYGSQGKGPRSDLEIFATPFIKYSLSQSTAATIFSDVLQLTHDFGTPPGLNNAPINFQPGFLWDLSSSVNINPYFSLIPENFKAVSIGMIINARML